MTEKDLDERIRNLEALEGAVAQDGYWGTVHDGKCYVDEIKQLIRDVLEAVKPERPLICQEECCGMTPEDVPDRFAKWEVIDELEAKAKELGL